MKNPNPIINATIQVNHLHCTITKFIEFQDGSAAVEEWTEGAFADLIHSEKFEAGTEDASDCIKAARSDCDRMYQRQIGSF